jgi:hypothetical protein
LREGRNEREERGEKGGRREVEGVGSRKLTVVVPSRVVELKSKREERSEMTEGKNENKGPSKTMKRTA